MRKYLGKITYNISENHPDKSCIKDYSKDKTYTFEDVYNIDENYFWSEESIIGYIKQDLKLVAGGGYDTKNVLNATYEIKQI